MYLPSFSPPGTVANCPPGTQFNNPTIWVEHSLVPPGEPVTFGYYISHIRCLICDYFSPIKYLQQVKCYLDILKTLFPCLHRFSDSFLCRNKVLWCCLGTKSCLAAKLCQSKSKLITTTAYFDKLFPFSKRLAFGNFRQCDPLLELSELVLCSFQLLIQTLQLSKI